MIGTLLMHPFLFLLTMFLLGIIAYLLFELRAAASSATFGEQSNGARMVFGSVIIIIGLLLHYTTVIDGISHKINNASGDASSISALKKLCSDQPNAPSILGATTQTGCLATTVLYYFTFVLVFIGLISIVVSLVHVGKSI